MSQGGNNEVARLNVAITGDVTQLAAAAKQGEQIAQQSAAKIEQITAQSEAKQTYMPGENYGPMYNAAAASVENATKAKARGFKELIKPMNEVLGAYSRLIGIGSLIGGMAATVVWAFNYKAQTAKKLKDDIDSLRESTESLFEQFGDGGTEGETALARYEERGKRLEETFENAVDAAKALNDGTGPGARLSSAGITAAENSAFRARQRLERQFIREKNKEATDSQLAFNKSQEDALQEQAKLVAKMLGGEAEEYINANLEVRKAQEIGDADLRDARIANIEFERDKRIQAMYDAEKKIADDAIAQAKRVDAEKRRLMKDFYRDARAAQAEGTMVESFFAGNQGQSFGLAGRQRGGIDGQLPSINYQGAE